MEKKQTIIVLLLVLALTFSVVSIALTLSIKNLEPVNIIRPQIVREIHPTSGANIILTVEGEKNERG